MSVVTEGPPIIEAAVTMARTGMLLCFAVHFITMFVGHSFKLPKLQRITVTITCTFAAFMVSTQITGSYFVWTVMSVGAFYTTFFLTPKYVGEDAAGGVTVSR